MLAWICLFLPGMITNWIRGRLISPGRKLKQEVLEYAMAVLGINYLMMLMLLAFGRGQGGLGQNIDLYMPFTFKYLTCTLILAATEPFWEKSMRSRIAAKGGIRKLFGIKDIAAGAALSAAAAFMIGIFAPLEIYFHNQQEFWFDLYSLIPLAAVLSAAGMLAGCAFFVFLYVVHPYAYQTVVVIGFLCLICTYVQGNFLAGGLPALDGAEIDWADYRSETAISVLLWCIAALALILVIKRVRLQKFCRIIQAACVCMTLILALSIISVCFMTKGYEKKKDVIVTVKDEFEMSKDENVIILLMDSFDASVFDEVMKDNPVYKDVFEDFTYFSDTLGGYPFTTRSIPLILSGEWYENQEPFEDYLNKVYQEAELFQTLEDQGYKMDVYESIVPPRALEDAQRFENVLTCGSRVTSYIDFAKLQLRLTGFKYAPYWMKRFCTLSLGEFQSVRKVLSEHEGFNWSTYQFYQNVLNTAFTYTDEKCFKFFHIEGAHVPFQYDKEVNYITEDATYEQNIEACITTADTYLQKLKNNGVYDNSVIIIMSDHGFNDGEVFGRQDPVLMIKGRGEKHAMLKSGAPVSFDDLQEAYMRLIDGQKSTEAFEWKEGDSRKRRYLWMETHLRTEHMVEYMQPGKAGDTDAMYKTGREFNLSDE